MRTTVTVRHCEVSDELRIRARELVGRLAKIAPRPQNAQVLFLADHGGAAVEVRLHAARGQVYVGTGEGAEHRSALDRAVARVRRQLDKAPTRRAPRRARASTAR
jgi:ribosome-associated translation inhibitor RaiA